MPAPAPRTPDHRRPVVVLVGLLALLLLPTSPAAAHPFIEGGELPVDSLVELTLQIAHGCGEEADGEGAATREVAVEVPDWLRVVEVTDHDGYDPDVEVSDGRTSVVTWRDAGGAEPAPAFHLSVVADGEPGETRYLRVFQGCEDTSYRWIGTPDEPADDPAIRVELAAADPDRPASPPEEVEEPEPGDDEPEDAVDDPQVDAREEPDAEPVAAEDERGEGLPRWLIPGLVAAAVIGLGIASTRRRRTQGRNEV